MWGKGQCAKRRKLTLCSCCRFYRGHIVPAAAQRWPLAVDDAGVVTSIDLEETSHGTAGGGARK